jgi:hypothetical protein
MHPNWQLYVSHRQQTEQLTTEQARGSDADLHTPQNANGLRIGCPYGCVGTAHDFAKVTATPAV